MFLTVTVRNIIMACYTAYLATEETIQCRKIKQNTIRRYLDTASKLLLPAKLMNPCLDIKGNLSIHIKGIIREVKRWEKIQNRKEAITKKLLNILLKRK